MSSGNTPSALNIRNVTLVSIIIRIVLIFYSEWHDKHAVVKYTDIDYLVFTDAARYLWKPTSTVDSENVAQGPLGKVLNLGNPYARDTYRYTPLLAVLMTPNIWLHPTFGKYLFSACDILVGLLLYRILLETILPSQPSKGRSPVDDHAVEAKATFYASLYLLNPMVFSISTRGSSESTIGAFVILTLYFVLSRKRSIDATAVMLGLATHWKVYPFIYGASLVAALGSDSGGRQKGGLWGLVKNFASWQGVRLAVVSFGTFMIMNAWMYLIWGYPFLFETYLYHLTRLDHKHNFSPYWLPIYLAYPDIEFPPPYPNLITSEEWRIFWRNVVGSPLASFVPQMLLTVGSGLVIGSRGRKHLPFAWFVQTGFFVTFNKVCTSQYFLWYLTILPLVLPSLSMSKGKVIAIIGSWAGAQAVWLKFAYDLEFLGKDTYYTVWGCSVLFLVINCWALYEIIRAYEWGIDSNSESDKTD